jgi:hypothetical protein
MSRVRNLSKDSVFLRESGISSLCAKACAAKKIAEANTINCLALFILINISI